MDHLTKSARSANMAQIKATNTKPEVLLRKALFAMGLRYRLHAKSLPGTPDIVFPKAKIAVFVNGCFWHRHSGCKFTTMPKSNSAFWQRKFAKTIERDKRVLRDIAAMDWIPLIVWTCEIRRDESLNATARKIAEIIRRRQKKISTVVIQ